MYSKKQSLIIHENKKNLFTRKTKIFLIIQYPGELKSFTVWCNQIGTVFEAMLSWTALTWHLRTKTTFKPNM